MPFSLDQKTTLSILKSRFRDRLAAFLDDQEDELLALGIRPDDDNELLELGCDDFETRLCAVACLQVDDEF